MEILIEPALTSIIVKSYEGECNDEGVYNGEGLAVLDNNSSYEGEFLNGLPHGKGLFTWADGVTFDGDFLNGKVEH
jgi:hypothetical protein